MTDKGVRASKIIAISLFENLCVSAAERDLFKCPKDLAIVTRDRFGQKKMRLRKKKMHGTTR